MLSKDDLEESITDHEKVEIRTIIESGLAAYDDPENYSAAARRDHNKSVRAHIRNSHINGEAQRVAAENASFRYTPARGRPLFTIRDKILVSFKKLDKNRRPRVGRTRQARLFMGQQPLPIELPPEITNVVAGYTMDEFETRHEVHVVCPGPKKNHWETRLDGPPPTELHAPQDIGPRLPSNPKRRIVARNSESGMKKIDGNEETAVVSS